MRAILGKDLGVLASFAKLDPSNRDILANVFVTEKDGGVEVSLSFRIRDRNPATPRAQRMQAPPTAVSIGLRKFWSVFEEELRTTVRATPPGSGSGRAPSRAPEVPEARDAAQPRGNRLATAAPARAQELAVHAQVALKNSQYATALPMALEALAIREQALGPTHVDVASSLNTLGEVYRGQGKFVDADRVHRRALEIREKELGRDHPDVAESLNNLAMLHNAQASFGDAGSLLKRALLILENVRDRGQPNYRLQAEVLENLAKVYRALGRNAEADEAMARATLMWQLE